MTSKPFSEARFVMMPEYVATEQGKKKYIDAEELMRAYGISPYQIATTDQHKAIWLGPRQSGDYKEHLAVRLKARGYAYPQPLFPKIIYIFPFTWKNPLTSLLPLAPFLNRSYLPVDLECAKLMGLKVS